MYTRAQKLLERTYNFNFNFMSSIKPRDMSTFTCGFIKKQTRQINPQNNFEKNYLNYSAYTHRLVVKDQYLA